VLTCGTASSSSGAATNDPASGGNDCLVDLTGVPNAQYITVTLASVVDNLGNQGDVPVTFGVLLGDTNGDGFVNSADISQTKSQSGQPVGGSNFREDVNTDGFLNSADISLVKSKSGTALPTLP
jgi:hypothetical protein